MVTATMTIGVHVVVYELAFVVVVETSVSFFLVRRSFLMFPCIESTPHQPFQALLLLGAKLCKNCVGRWVVLELSSAADGGVRIGTHGQSQFKQPWSSLVQ